MRRILLVLTVALVVAAMVVVTAAPAFAKNTFQLSGRDTPGPPQSSGAAGSGEGASVLHCNSPSIGSSGNHVVKRTGNIDHCA